VECDTCSLVQDYEDTAWKHRKLYPDSTLYYCDLAIEESIRTSDTLGLAKLYNFKGIAYHYKGDNVGSYDYYLLAYNYAISHSDTLQMGHAMNNLGRFYSSQGNYTEAFDYCNRALDLFRDLNDLDGIAYSQKRISEMYLAQGYLQEALKITRESLQIRLDHFRDARQAHAHIDLARIFALLDISDSAFYHYQLAKEKGVAANDIVAMTNTELGLSELEIQLTNYRKGLTYAVNADELAKSYDNQDLKNRVSIQYGIALYLNSKINESEEEFMNVLQHSKASNQLELQKQAHLFLSKIYLKRNDGFKAYNHRVQYGEINDQLSQSEARRAIDSLLFIVELDRRKGDNVLLKATQEANEAVLAESKIRNILLSVVLVAVILFAYILWTNGRRTKQLNLDLTDKNSRINDQQKEISLQNNRLKERNLLLKEANTEKDFLMNVVAHDLKAPINNVLGISTLLKMSTPNKEQEELIDMLVTVSERNLALIRDLLDVSAFEENERKMNIQELDVLELLEDTISINQQVAELKNIEIKLLSESTGTKINSDKEYCSRIFNNLLSNAIKFSNPGDEVELSAIEKDSKVVVTIKDHGPGFTDDDKNNLYKKFTKLSARPTQGENSSGLGLALVKTLVNKLEAKIELESKEGEGSEFTLSFDI
jgi:signal transduction histidine kinase